MNQSNHLQPEKILQSGTIVSHFKRDLKPNGDPLNYLYEILHVAEHTESGEALVIYRALYGNRKIYARPKDMFLEPVDRSKYPDAKQTYRFEKFSPCPRCRKNIELYLPTTN